MTSNSHITSKFVALHACKHGDGNIAYKVDKYYGNSYNTKEWYRYDVMNHLTDIGLTSITSGACTNYIVE